jgi:4'-phosphopantetheinyl transferase
MLCAAEERRLSTLKIEKRRRDWLLGRWTAKHLVQGYLAETANRAVALNEIRIENAEDGSPYCVLQGTGSGGEGLLGASSGGEELPVASGERLPVSLSISHSHGYAFCALCQETEMLPAQELRQGHAGVGGAAAQVRSGVRWSLGCDIEWIEHREQSFVSDFFTAQEIRDVMGTPVEQRDCRVTAIWSAKEAVLKSLRTGLRLDTRRIVCRFEPDDLMAQTWTPLTVLIDAELVEQYPGAWYAWWQVQEGFVMTMALREESAYINQPCHSLLGV